MDNNLKIGLTHGDINGSSYELVMKLLEENKVCEFCTPILYGSPKVVAYFRKALENEAFNLSQIKSPVETTVKRGYLINTASDTIKVELGRETEESAAAAMASLEQTLSDAERNYLDAVVALPQGPQSLKIAHASSLVDFLSSRYEKEAMSIVINSNLRMGFVTEQIPLSKVTEQISSDRVLSRIKLLNEALKSDFTVLRPKIAVLSLNPEYVVDNSADAEIVSAIEKARAEGIMAIGPFQPEHLFGDDLYHEFDAVLAMYNAQGMIPLRLLEENTSGSAYYVAGLPVICAACFGDCGFDITAQNLAEPQPLRTALYLALDVARNRQANEEAAHNPLPHYELKGNFKDLNVADMEELKNN